MRPLSQPRPWFRPIGGRTRPDTVAVNTLTSDHTAGNLPYGASKGALDRIVISAARELGPRGIVAFLLSPQGRWVSGQPLTTDGGFSARF